MDALMIIVVGATGLVVGLLIGWDDGFRTGFRRAREHLYYLPRPR